tara:strand:+ start:30 stop:716 length:687 start_codon:yes stop_codon:yes gene_type:complete
MKILVAGATSHLAQEFIKLICPEYNILALVRSGESANLFSNLVNVESVIVNYDSNEFKNLLGKIEKKDQLVFINFSTLTIDGLFINQDLDSFKKVHDANVMTSISALMVLIEKMISAKWGRIILLSSTRALRGDIGISPYSLSKSSLSGLSNVISKEYAKFNITSNVIDLGYFGSPLWEKIPTHKRKDLINQIPSKRIGQAEDLIPIFKCLIESSYINGAHLSLDGGL